MVAKILVYGGRGALGSVCVEHFKNLGHWVCSLDFNQNAVATSNVTIRPSEILADQSKQVLDEVETLLDGEKLDAVICVAGGWAGGDVGSADFIKNVDLLTKQSIWSSLIAAQLSQKFSKSEGLLVLTGADSALKSTPSMIAYGMVKAAVHHLTSSLAKDASFSKDICVAAILPVTLDTPMNRKWMPKADTSKWTPLSFLAELFSEWLVNHEGRPKSGSLVRLQTESGATTLQTVQQE